MVADNKIAHIGIYISCYVYCTIINVLIKINTLLFIKKRLFSLFLLLFHHNLIVEAQDNTEESILLRLLFCLTT